VNVVVSSDRADGASSAANTPWVARAVTSIGKLTEAPPTAEAAANPASPVRNVTLRPIRSASRPENSSRLPNDSAYAVTIHCRSALVNRSARCADGSARFITVTSSTIMRAAKQMVARISHRREPASRALTMSLTRLSVMVELRGGFRVVATRPARLVADGDTIGSLRVLATPGHTPGHLAFFDPRNGTVYAGDVFTTTCGVATSAVVPWQYPMAGLATWNRGLGLESARRLRDLAPVRLASGHGPVIEAPGPAMARAIAAAARRIQHPEPGR
jgi:hypothetical protein